MAIGKKTGGRRRGTPNRATGDARECCAKLVDDPAYQAKLRRRLLSGELAPALECMLWHYAHGKPKDALELDTNASLPLSWLPQLEPRPMLTKRAASESRAGASAASHGSHSYGSRRTGADYRRSPP